MSEESWWAGGVYGEVRAPLTINGSGPQAPPGRLEKGGGPQSSAN